MFLEKLFNFKFSTKCQHEKITPDVDFGYCPDCGKLVRNEWYITRCACCGVKLISNIKNNDITPANKFCHNCGAQEYTIEKLEKINFIDINYAVLKKTELKSATNLTTTTQCWQEKTDEKPKLLTQYL